MRRSNWSSDVFSSDRRAGEPGRRQPRGHGDQQRAPAGGVTTVAGVSEPVRVLVVDDDRMVRDALSLLLDGAPAIEVVGTASDGDEVPADRKSTRLNSSH